ncbi:MAG TPA: DNA polymerase III subunit gamma/tau [Alphaproteobacteria bacterium]|nr:DNA polymerase III subunit gamma/tau [Alphaproteobacteria bacterium]
MTDLTPSGDPTPYRVLARKYRPGRFAELIGQEAMVRTLTNAFKQSRLAHAFVLTGVRGVGKTTTARIIAKALNCTGVDGKGGPTVEPCGVCEHCVAIAADRDVDVIEMDAASRTGVDDIRELIDGVRYRPITARYKVYIIDEVHMLSKNAFNALLKTLEEPPEHVKFIFATTEIRKVPITVLSRCQRFDLRRVDQAVLADHLAKVAAAEGAALAPEAIQLVARAADGSVRDGLSLLDQAIAHGAGAPSVEQVREMLGLADRSQIVDLFDLLMKGAIKNALILLGELYKAGADPVVVLQDLLETCHWLTLLKIDAAAEGPVASDAERARGLAMAAELPMPSLARAWQMLLKGLSEAQTASMPLMAAEMALIRLAYAADLPSPAELVKSLSASAPASPSPGPSSRADAATASGGNGAVGRGAAAPPAPSASRATGVAATGAPAPAGGRPQAMLARRAEAVAPDPIPAAAPEEGAPRDFEALVELVEIHEPILGAHLRNNVHLVRFEPGRLELRPNEHALANLAPRLTTLLHDWTGRRWTITVSNQAGAATLAEQAKRRAADRRAEAEHHPLVQAILQRFPGAAVERVRDLAVKAKPPDAADELPASFSDGDFDT